MGRRNSKSLTVTATLIAKSNNNPPSQSTLYNTLTTVMRMQKRRKIKFHYTDRRHKSIMTEWAKFYSLLDPFTLYDIHADIFDSKKDYQMRKKVYKKYRSKLNHLRPIFKKVTIEQNKFAQSMGFDSWIEWSLNNKGIRPEQIEFFVNNVDEVIEKLYKRIPRVNEVPSWWWTKYALPHCHSHVKTPDYQIPNEIIKLVTEMEPNFEKYLDKISIEHGERLTFPYCQFIQETKTCLIKVNLKAICFYEKLSLVHELAHAFDFLADANNAKNPMEKTHYKHERFANEFVQKFVDHYLKNKARDAVNGRILEDLVLAIFEYNIYKHPDKDFDELYADAHNRVFPISKQKSNDLYLVRDTVILRPAGMIETGIIDTEIVLSNEF
jgi:hypothetical protein